ncbi:hypothetical protein [Paenibacillus sp. GbtcB18]|uniref:hypothetical protein n=1 Tax=Paenibacillus sp. GbtcB18 TaxID=2824763 RepID=UPI001C2F7615|nr:hypothetical protein [Paenibacillus sp. GbtcB18]
MSLQENALSFLPSGERILRGTRTVFYLFFPVCRVPVSHPKMFADFESIQALFFGAAEQFIVRKNPLSPEQRTGQNVKKQARSPRSKRTCLFFYECAGAVFSGAEREDSVVRRLSSFRRSGPCQ